ncbi:unnamed protein product [Rotaria sordida]|uniref:Uncharacterized protein n=1 Tax=Rotaria sordida TaxID=392033 RepID=A0A819K3J5_9BILA|nr:unnamed protein product [Rotaria sordida]
MLLSDIKNQVQSSPPSTSTAADDVELVNVDNINNSLQNNQILDDISRSCDDTSCQPILKNYPTNEDNRSFQTHWYNNRP